MTLYTTIDDIKEFIGGAANISMEIGSINPIIERTAYQHIIPHIGKEVWNQLVAEYAVTTYTGENEALLPYVQRPLAMLSLYEYSKIGNIQFSETGIHRFENENMKSAYKYQENEYRKWMLDHGYEEIERLLLFLQENKADFPLWTASSVYAKNKALVINSAADFRTAADKNLTRYTFEIVRPLIEDIELFSLIPNMGQDQYDDLKTKIAAETALGTEETKLLGLIQKVVSNFTIEEAIRRQLVRLDGPNVIQTESLEPQSYRKETSPGNAMTSLKINHHDEWANRYVSRMVKYLDDNLDIFTLYSDWKAALAAAALAAEDVLCEDAERPLDTSICYCTDACSCSNTSTSVFRL